MESVATAHHLHRCDHGLDRSWAAIPAPGRDPRSSPVGEDLGRLIEFAREPLDRRFDAEFVAAHQQQSTVRLEADPGFAESVPGRCPSLLQVDHGLSEALDPGRPSSSRPPRSDPHAPEASRFAAGAQRSHPSFRVAANPKTSSVEAGSRTPGSPRRSAAVGLGSACHRW